MSEAEIVEAIKALMAKDFDEVTDAQIVALVRGLNTPVADVVAVLVGKRLKQLRLRAMACTFASLYGVPQ